MENICIVRSYSRLSIVTTKALNFCLNFRSSLVAVCVLFDAF